MSTEKTEGVVIRQADFSETSRVVTIFTRDFGKITVVAKGARRLKGPFEAAIDLLTACRLVFIRKSSSSLDILTEAQLISRFRPSGHDLFGLYGGYYIAELLSSLTEEYDPHPRLYGEAIACLERLSQGDSPKTALLRFELVLLQEIGQFPALDLCVMCNRPIEKEQAYAYWVSQGGLLCARCRKEEYQGNRIQAGTIAVLQRLASDSPDVQNRLIVSPQQQQEIRRINTAAISYVLGRRPKTLRYLQF